MTLHMTQCVSTASTEDTTRVLAPVVDTSVSVRTVFIVTASVDAFTGLANLTGTTVGIVQAEWCDYRHTFDVCITGETRWT